MIKLDDNKTKNIKIILDEMIRGGITNRFLQIGILATISKESEFIPQTENLNYSLQNIKRVWPNIPEIDARVLAHNSQKLGDYVYGGKYGNEKNEGFKYRGRGYNQITFKDTYKKFGTLIKTDLVSNPDLLNDPIISAKVAVQFFLDQVKAGIKDGTFTKFTVKTLNDIDTLEEGIKVAIQINAGRGTKFENNIVQEGYKKALDNIPIIMPLIP